MFYHIPTSICTLRRYRRYLVIIIRRSFFFVCFFLFRYLSSTFHILSSPFISCSVLSCLILSCFATLQFFFLSVMKNSLILEKITFRLSDSIDLILGFHLIFPDRDTDCFIDTSRRGGRKRGFLIMKVGFFY